MSRVLKIISLTREDQTKEVMVACAYCIAKNKLCQAGSRPFDIQNIKQVLRGVIAAMCLSLFRQCYRTDFHACDSIFSAHRRGHRPRNSNIRPCDMPPGITRRQI